MIGPRRPAPRRVTRRQLLGYGAKACAVWTLSRNAWNPAAAGIRTGLWVNDVHSGLNATRVARIASPDSLEKLQEEVHRAGAQGTPLSLAAGRHAMGGQQFGTDTVLIDLNHLNRVLEFDARGGEVEVESGMRWPELVEFLVREQRDAERPWGIVQKQTGADRLSLGGAVSANAHGRGLRFKPLVSDVAALTLVDADGEKKRCSRSENPELFRLAVGGYGLFGIIASVRLRLGPRRKLQRIVEVADASGIAQRFAERIEAGFLYGDFQYSTDAASDTLLRKGVFSCYRPVDPDTPVPETPVELPRSAWMDLICLGHVRRGEAFRKYSEYYLSTSGQIYWSDTHQLSVYIDDYHEQLRRCLGKLASGSEMITEIYVPREALGAFLEAVRQDVVSERMNLIYGTVRLIEADDETFLAWAKQPYACVIFNLHVQHDAASLRKAQSDFRRLIDRGIGFGGSYFLTYHRWATKTQVLACYPELPRFLEKKKQYDPRERFQSDWYRHYRGMFPAEGATRAHLD
jgi:FAD/FMN-containing dehydrogenase